MSISDILVQKCANQLCLRALVQVARDAIIFLHKPSMGLLEVGCARALNDELLRLEFVVLASFLQQHLFKLLLIKFARVFAHLNEHLDGGANLSFLNDFAIALKTNVLHEEADQAILDRLVLDHVVLKLTVLHVLNER